MRIAYVITRSSEVGGAHIHVRDLAKWLQNNGHDVKVFVGGNGPFIDLLDEASIPHLQLKHMKRSISLLRDVIAMHELAIALNKFEPDIVAAHSAKGGVIARLASFLKGLPCVFTAHGWSFAEGVEGPEKTIFLALERLLSPLSSHIITVCEHDKILAQDKRVAKPRKITTIYNGIPEIDSASLTKDYSTEADRLTIMMVARFERQKDHHTLINALKHLKDLEWNLVLVGDGPLLEEIKILCLSHGIYQRTQFLGRRLDIAELLEKADIFVLITRWEGFPVSILEAMRAHLPVVATDVAGVPESVNEGVTGYLTPVGDYEAVSSRLRELLSSPYLRQEMGEAGAESFYKHFTFRTMANATLRVYQTIVDFRKK